MGVDTAVADMLTAVGLVDETAVGELTDYSAVKVRASAIDPGGWTLRGPDTPLIRSVARTTGNTGEPNGGLLVSDPETGFVWSGYTTKATLRRRDGQAQWEIVGSGHLGLLKERVVIPVPSQPDPSVWPAGSEWSSTFSQSADLALQALALASMGAGTARAHPRMNDWKIDRTTAQPAPPAISLSGRMEQVLDLMVDRLAGFGLTISLVADGKGGLDGVLRQSRVSQFEADDTNLGASVDVTTTRPEATAVYAGSKSGGSDDDWSYQTIAGAHRIEAFATVTGTGAELDEHAAAALAARGPKLSIEVLGAGPAAIAAFGREFRLGDWVTIVAAGTRHQVQATEATFNLTPTGTATGFVFGHRPAPPGATALARVRRLEQHTQRIAGARWFL